MYIRDYVEYHKTIHAFFSYRTISARAKINSSGFYPLIVQGKRDLTESTIKKTCVALEFDEIESEYFSHLVHFNQATSLTEKNRYFDLLLSILNTRSPQIIEYDRFDIFSAWYHGAIRELVVCRDFKNDFRALGRMLRPEITEKQARESVNLLLRLCFLKQEDGNYIQTSPVISTGSDIKSHQILNYQISMLKLAIDAFDRFGPTDHISNSSTTIRISKETYELFKVKNREHRRALLDLAIQDDNADQVYQLNINMFPLSNPKHGKNQE
jgi:uncharacterized protein (TIGR02147 family)